MNIEPTEVEATPLPHHLHDIAEIYLEPSVPSYPRGREILARYPNARRIEVASHWRIPELHGNPDLVSDWNRVKREVLVLGARKSFTIRPNGRSSDFIAPGEASGCALACAYCYVPRRKGYANPITLFVNIEEIGSAIAKHANKQGMKLEPNLVDPDLWVYELGENGDCSVDAALCDNMKDLVALFRTLPNAKGTWATKFVNRDLLSYDPQGRTRLRFSLMPPEMSKLVDVRTSPISDRISAINDFVDAGYEVHLNFSPVIIRDGWLDDYEQLFRDVGDAISEKARAQLACEIIFLTHNEGLHELNLGWHPKAEDVLWRPDLQETKVSNGGGINVRYKTGFKGRQVKALTDLLEKHLPTCRVRYAF